MKIGNRSEVASNQKILKKLPKCILYLFTSREPKPRKSDLLSQISCTVHVRVSKSLLSFSKGEDFCGWSEIRPSIVS
jgi:hypothetical protein